MKASAYAVGECNIRPDFCLTENPMAQVVRFWPEIRRQICSNRKMGWFLSSRCYQRQHAAAEQSMRRMETQLYSDVASRPAQSVGGVSLRGQTAAGWRELGPTDQGEAPSARTSPWIRTRIDYSSSSSSQCHSAEIQNSRSG